MRPIVDESEPAILDLLATASYLERDDPDVARRFLRQARRTFELLADRPEIGRPRGSPEQELSGVRSWPVVGFEKHLVFYRPIRNGVEIVRVLHGARDIESLLPGERDSE